MRRVSDVCAQLVLLQTWMMCFSNSFKCFVSNTDLSLSFTMFYEPLKIACGSVCIKNVVILVDIVIALPVGRANANAGTD